MKAYYDSTKRMNTYFENTMKNTPYLEKIKGWISRHPAEDVDKLTPKNKAMFEKIIETNMTEQNFKDYTNMLSVAPAETIFIGLMDSFDLWLYEKPYEIFQEKFGKELVRKSKIA